MKKLRVNMCFNEADNPEVIRLMEVAGTKRPSGLIHDLVRKGLILESLIAGRLIANVAGAQSETRGIAPRSEEVAHPEPSPVSTKPEPKVVSPKRVEHDGSAIQSSVVEPTQPGEPTYNPNCLGDLGMDM